MLLSAIVKSIRPPFLLLTLVCIALSSSLALSSGVIFNQTLMCPVLLAALLAHISVNMLNEYQDYSSGLDLNTLRTPFSGGSGALPLYPQAAKTILSIALLCMVLTALLGLYLIAMQGAVLLIPGILGLLLIAFYTTRINAMPWLCLIAPGSGFGFFMVLGSYFALTGSWDMRAMVISVLPFLLVNNLLLLNQYPDISADRAAGRNHFPIRFGIDVSNRVYLLFVIAAMVVIVYAILMAYLTSLSWLALLPLMLGLYAYTGAVRYRDRIGEYPHYLAANVGVALFTPLILAVDLYLST